MRSLARRYELDGAAERKLERLLAALESEPAPPTTVSDAAQAVEVHLADSLSGLAVPGLMSAARLADVGAGAGFPGLALAAALPQSQVDLVEATGRKCEVIERLAAAAGIPNARAIARRAEEWAATGGRGAYDAVTVRAVAPLPVLCEYGAPLLRDGGTLVCWKGARSDVEEGAGAMAAGLVGLSPIDVRSVNPFPASRSRHLHVFQKVAATPARFPRRAGVAVKRPLAG